MPLRLALLALLLLGPADQTVLTRDGRRLVGAVRLSGQTVIVQAAAGAVELPADQVVCVFRDPREAVRRAESLHELAKKAFESGKSMPDRDPARNAHFQGAIDMLSQARDIFEAVSRHYPGDPYGVSRSISTTMQLMRLCRDQKGSDVATQLPETADAVPLISGDYSFSPPDPPRPAGIVEGDLGPGQVSLLKGLSHNDPKVRADTVRKLADPPAPHALPALVAMIENEPNDDVLKAIGEVLAAGDLTALVKSFDGPPASPTPPAASS